jgi:hypothetical protein
MFEGYIRRFGYHQRYDYLKKSGLMNFEARELARHYTIKQLRSIPYLQSFIKSRRLYIINMRKRDYTDKEISKRLHTLYIKRKWLDNEGKISIWARIRDIRKKEIDSGDYIPAKRKGSHHKVGSGISKGNLSEQRKKRKVKTLREKDIERINADWLRAAQSGNRNEMRKLEQERNKKYGY